jgi:hypothetical protein
MTDFNAWVFIVDGLTEIRSFDAKLSKDFRSVPAFRQAACGGKGVDAQGYANAVYGTIIAVLSGHYRRILCITDRESRTQAADAYADDIRRELIERVASSTHFSREELDAKIRVCVPDKMFENWIVADVRGIRTCSDLVSGSAQQDSYDGTNGSAVLKRLMVVAYKKTLHGPRLFKRVSFKRAAANSPSFALFTGLIDK